jgi:hypothetical protein
VFACICFSPVGPFFVSIWGIEAAFQAEHHKVRNPWVGFLLGLWNGVFVYKHQMCALL